MEELRRAAAALQDEAVAFLRELIRIPSPSGGEGAIVEAVRRRMEAVGFDEIRVDGFGNVLGRIGSGPRTLAFDAHLDTVGAGDLRLWTVDPFAAEMRDGVVYGRGACDQKAGMAALVYAGALMRRLDLARNATVWIVGSVLEEDCEGLCWHYILTRRVLDPPDLVVLTEPTDLRVVRGQRGRMEIEVTARGVSCHGSAPERGVNAIDRMIPILWEIERLGETMPKDPFLGRGSIAVTEIRSAAPSLCAVPDSCTIHLDRRLTAGETDEGVLAAIERIAGAAGGEVAVPIFQRPSHTGYVLPMRQYFPAWTMPEGDRHVRLALRAREVALGEAPAPAASGGTAPAPAPAASGGTGTAPPGAGRPGRWDFSTNGVATRGMHGIPTIGFGPASERHAHTPADQCPVAHVGGAIAFYAALARLFGGDDAMEGSSGAPGTPRMG